MENKEWMFNRILDNLGESREGMEGEFGEISLDMLEKLTEPNLTEEYVSNSNEELTDMYKSIVVSYGFQDFYSLYLYSLGDKDNEVYKATAQGKKDFSKLNKVRRTVIRNGRRTTMTFYEKPKEFGKGKGTGSEEEGNSLTGVDAKELKIVAEGSLEKPITIKELQRVNNMSKGLVVDGELEDIFRVKMYVDEELKPRAYQGLSLIKDKYITTEFSARDGLVTGFYPRIFFETIKIAMNSGKGVLFKIDGSELQRTLAESSGLEEEDGNFVGENEKLEELFGRLP